MKTLIVFCSKYGATNNCALRLQKGLMGQVDTFHFNKQKEELIQWNMYDTILIGSAIYGGRIDQKFKTFIEVNKESIEDKQLGLFLCCKEEGDGALTYINNNFPQWLVKRAKIIQHVGHEINLNNMNGFERFLLKTFFKVKESYSQINVESINTIINKLNEKAINHG